MALRRVSFQRLPDARRVLRVVFAAEKIICLAHLGGFLVMPFGISSTPVRQERVRRVGLRH